VNARGEAGRTPLHVAIICNHTESVRVLLEQGAEVSSFIVQGNCFYIFL
jgi:ankyrin repeat protein